jgi:hypothetical protein
MEFVPTMHPGLAVDNEIKPVPEPPVVSIVYPEPARLKLVVFTITRGNWLLVKKVKLFAEEVMTL